MSDNSTIVQLAMGYQRASQELTEHRLGIAPLIADEVRERALRALKNGQRISKRIAEARWGHVVEALTAGIGIRHVAAVLATDRTALLDELTEWAEGQHTAFLITDQRHRELRGLIAKARSE